MGERLKIMTVLGTRPEIIRLSRVINRLDQHVDHVLVHTGQNSDYELNEIFFDDLQVRQPDHFLSINRESLGRILGEVLIKTETVLREEKPDAMLILGDTNSAFAAIIAKRMKIPVYHMEAGNRCFDLNVPEEMNRRIIDHISDFNLVYTEHARRNLLAEGVHARRIYLTGSPMCEVLHHAQPGIQESEILSELGLEMNKFILVSMHRAENVDISEHLKSLLDVMNRLCDQYDMPVIVSTHPRTRQRLDAIDHPVDDRIRFLKPFGYFDYVRLQVESMCTLSDSGTISEESSMLGFPAVTMRTAMERPEAMDSGHIILTGHDSNTIIQSIEYVVASKSQAKQHKIAAEYQVENTSHRVLKLILGTAKLGHLWDGIIAAA